MDHIIDKTQTKLLFSWCTCTIELLGAEVVKVQEFKYSRDCRREVKNRVQAGWNSWRKVSGVICDRRVSAKVKGKGKFTGRW